MSLKRLLVACAAALAASMSASYAGAADVINGAQAWTRGSASGE